MIFLVIICKNQINWNWGVNGFWLHSCESKHIDVGFSYHIGTRMFDWTHTQTFLHTLYYVAGATQMAQEWHSHAWKVDSSSKNSWCTFPESQEAKQQWNMAFSFKNNYWIPQWFWWSKNMIFVWFLGYGFSSRCETFHLAISPLPLFLGDHWFWMFVAAHG